MVISCEKIIEQLSIDTEAFLQWLIREGYVILE
jgi:hypothetical protein